MAKYSEYKASNIPWVNEIPSHWKVTKAKRLWKKEQRDVMPEDDIVTAFRDGTVTLRKKRREDGFTVSLKEIGYQGVRKGDLVIHQMDAFAGAIGVSDSDGKCTPVYSICTPIKDANPYYYNFLLREMSRSKFILSLAKGIRERSTDFRFDMFGELEVPVPPASEQQAIVDYIQYKLFKIDTFVKKKRKIVKLLKEQKSVIINKAITKGIDSSNTMKPSGIPDVGEIPESWTVKPLKYYMNIQGGYAFNSSEFKDSGVQILKIGNLYQNTLHLERQPTFVDASYLESHKAFIVSKGNILMSLTGTLGKRDYGYAILLNLKDKYLLNQRVAKLSATTDVLPDYLIYVLQSEMYLNQLYRLPSGTKQANLSNSNVLNVKVAIPNSEHERSDIVKFIEEHTQQIDLTIAKIEGEISIVQELKAAMLAEAVTGKLDVRNFAFEQENKFESVEA